MTAPTTVANPLASLEAYFEASKACGLYQMADLEVFTPKVELIYSPGSPTKIMRLLEAAIRTAYKSEDKIGPNSHKKIIRHVMSLKHESTLEHIGFTFRITTSRGVTHELVRHRLASYTQESTRYVNYLNRPPQVILPWYHRALNNPDIANFWSKGMQAEFKLYRDFLQEFPYVKAQDARGFLPNDCKTEIVTTMNIRSFRHFLKLRTDKSAHPDMQVVAREVLRQLHKACPVLFEDLVAAAAKHVLPVADF